MSQLFFSLSVSMGIMITYGSYVDKDVNISKAIAQIEFFDTGVAFLAESICCDGRRRTYCGNRFLSHGCCCGINFLRIHYGDFGG